MTKLAKKFEELECWKEARNLVKLVYQATQEQPFSKDFGLKEQIQRASVSVMANAAEGFNSFSRIEFVRFLRIALRSSTEVQSHLYVALDVGYLGQENFNRIKQQSEKCSNFIKAFIKYLKGLLKNALFVILAKAGIQ